MAGEQGNLLTYALCVCRDRLRICMSSIMRRRSGVITTPLRDEQRHMAPAHRLAVELSGQREAADCCHQRTVGMEKRSPLHRITAKRFSPSPVIETKLGQA